jgi:signal transduction histidine kinase
VSIRAFVAKAPLAFKVPVLVAILTISVAVMISQVVLTRLGKEQTQSLQNLTSAFMDGLSASATPGMLRQDVWETFDSIDRVRRQYGGVKVLFIVSALPDGEVLAASDPEHFPVRSALPKQLTAIASQNRELIIDEETRKAWLVRQVEQENVTIGAIIAEIDISDILAVRQEIFLTLFLVNSALTLLFSAAGYLLVRRMVRPLSIIQRKLADAASGDVEPIADSQIIRAGGEYSEVFKQFNRMVRDQAERKSLQAEIANHEKLALLGQLASGMAHEVNNPLGGLMNAVDTLDKYGDDQDTRQKTINLLRRGLNGIQQVVRAALVTYKSGDKPLLLTRSDLEDMPFLLQHETGSKHLRLDWDNRLPDEVRMDAAAIRQIALNLLLNACAASPEHGTVSFEAVARDGDLVVRVSDEGAGMPTSGEASVRAGLTGDEPPRGSGLGLWTAGRLASRLRGNLKIDRDAHGGCQITLTAPIAQSEEEFRAVA